LTADSLIIRLKTYTLGSTRAFVAFMRCMLDKDLVAIALCTFRKDSGPEICALMPQVFAPFPRGLGRTQS
jgi:hypothetical protein